MLLLDTYPSSLNKSRDAYCQAPGPGPDLALTLAKSGPGVDTIIKQATPPPPQLGIPTL